MKVSLKYIGILIIYVAGTYMDWRYLSILCAVLSVPFLICMLLIPETPRWFIAKGNYQVARPLAMKSSMLKSLYFTNTVMLQK